MNTDFAAGQQWAYRTRPGEERSTLTVLKVEDYSLYGILVHISVEDINMRAPASSKIVTEIKHFVLTETALQQSVSQLIRIDAPLTNFDSEYVNWRNLFVKGKGKVFDIEVSEVINYFEAMASLIYQDKNVQGENREP
ncbi:MAG: hypothetical protein NUV91_07340 [Candidatus Omnitrophica bacterium]|nr:hypothetical protein [Candidatus Omnitrophota bacterium]